MEQPQTIELEYVKFLEENNLSNQQLPKEIRQQITVLKAQVGRYKKNPTEAQKNMVTKQDVTVCDLIADFIEEGITDEQEKKAELLAERESKIKDLKYFISADETINYKTASDEEFNKLLEKLTNAKAAHETAEKQKQAAADAEKERLKKEKEEKAKQTPEEAAKNQPVQYSPEAQAMMKAIKEHIVNGKISKSKLQEIIQRKPAEPTQIVGSIKLRKVFLRNEYQLVN